MNPIYTQPIRTVIHGHFGIDSGRVFVRYYGGRQFRELVGVWWPYY